MTTFRIWVLTGIATTAAVLASQGLRLLPESSPVQRGAAAANSNGCIECHGQPEPGFPDDATFSCAARGINVDHARYYGRCADILAFFEVVRLKRSFSTRAKFSRRNYLLEGERLARQYNCFQCHGELGQGGLQNAGALKGYIPGYFGRDFAALTHGGEIESVEAWIRNGIDPALVSQPIKGPIVEYFIERQEVSMPVFESLPDSTIRVLADYVIALHQLGAMNAEAIRAYSQETRKQGSISHGDEPESG